MRIIKNVKAISRLSLILLLIISMVIGALLSYLWVVGYYESLEYHNPETPSITISNVTFNPQNTTYFNLTLLYPTYSASKEPVTVTKIAVSTEDGALHNVVNVQPSLPHEFPRGESEIFECFWNWANYTSETVEISVSVENGSGSTREYRTPLVDLQIIDVRFNSTISVSHFNVTVKNSESSVAHVNVTRISVNAENVSVLIPYTLPYTLHPNDSVPFMCSWNWAEYQGQDVTIAVHTLQGYTAYYPKPPNRTTLPPPVVLEITDVLFDVANRTYFNVTVVNSEDSPTYITLSEITVAVENETFSDIPVIPPPNLPYTLYPSANVTFGCFWNWSNYREKNITTTVHTLQGLVANYVQFTPAQVILEITNPPIFNPLDTNHFNITVKNSEFSLQDANITTIAVNIENKIILNVTQDVIPSIPRVLGQNESVQFNCTWSWGFYRGKNVTVIVQTLKGYRAFSPLVTLAVPTITSVLFNPLNTNHFFLTIQNPTLLNFTIVGMNVTIEGMSSINITAGVVPSLPFTLPSGTDITFMCSWNWTDQRDKVATITVYTLEGYKTSYRHTLP